MPWTVSASASAPRDPKLKPIDKSALYAIAQAAVKVELFTIPLYMARSTRSRASTRSKPGTASSRGGCGPAADHRLPTTANEKAFNIVFSVFIQEMLHLQLASNIDHPERRGAAYTSKALMEPTRTPGPATGRTRR